MGRPLTAILTAIAGLLTAIGTLVSVLFVHARKAAAEAELTRAETREVLSRLTDSAAATKDQVKNSHSRNLRDDIDRIHDAVKRVVELASRTDQNLTVLSAEQRHYRDRLERLAGDATDVHSEVFKRLRRLEDRYVSGLEQDHGERP